MNCYEIKTASVAGLTGSTFYVSAPSYKHAEMVSLSEHKGERIDKITLIGECFNYSSLYEDQKASCNTRVGTKYTSDVFIDKKPRINRDKQ